MATFDYNGKTYYIDGRLKADLEKKVVPDLKKKDKDRVFIIDGRERSGKSVFGMILGGFMAASLGSEFNTSNICMKPEEFRNKIETSSKNSVIIYDEAHRGMGSARALSEINNILKDLMMEMGQRNLFVIVILPTFFLLEKYVALFRATGLFHVYERRNKRGFWCYFNERSKQRLYMRGKKEFNYNCMRWPYYRGRFLDQYTISEEEYRVKKAQSFKQVNRELKSEKYLSQRNQLLYILAKEFEQNATNLGRLCKKYGVGLKRTTISAIIAKFKGTSLEK